MSSQYAAATKHKLSAQGGPAPGSQFPLVCMWLPVWGWVTWVWGGHRVRRVLHNPNPQLGEHRGSHWLLLLLFKLGSLRSSCALNPDVFPLQEQNSLVQPLLLPSCELLNKNYTHLYVFQNRPYWIKKLTLSSFSSSSVTSPSTSSKAALHGYKMLSFRTLYKNTLRLGGEGAATC